MPRPCSVNAFVDLRACSSPARLPILPDLVRSAGGVLTPWSSLAALDAALAAALQGLAPQALVIAGDDQSFGEVTRRLLAAPLRTLQAVEAIPISFLDVSRGLTRRLIGLPSGGWRAQCLRLARVLADAHDGQPLSCVAAPTLRVIDSDASRALFGFSLSVGAHIWAAEQSLRLPSALRRVASTPLRWASLFTHQHSGGAWSSTLDPNADGPTPDAADAQRPDPQTLWVGSHLTARGGTLRAAQGERWHGMVKEVLYAGRLGEQAPFWDHPQAVGLRCDDPPDQGSAYLLDGSLRYGNGQRVVEVIPGPLLTALNA
jgi:hypothetical protein